jgi:hypothetical protein
MSDSDHEGTGGFEPVSGFDFSTPPGQNGTTSVTDADAPSIETLSNSREPPLTDLLPLGAENVSDIADKRTSSDTHNNKSVMSDQYYTMSASAASIAGGAYHPTDASASVAGRRFTPRHQEVSARNGPDRQLAGTVVDKDESAGAFRSDSSSYGVDHEVAALVTRNTTRNTELPADMERDVRALRCRIHDDQDAPRRITFRVAVLHKLKQAYPTEIEAVLTSLSRPFQSSLAQLRKSYADNPHMSFAHQLHIASPDHLKKAIDYVLAVIQIIHDLQNTLSEGTGETNIVRMIPLTSRTQRSTLHGAFPATATANAAASTVATWTPPELSAAVMEDAATCGRFMLPRWAYLYGRLSLEDGSPLGKLASAVEEFCYATVSFRTVDEQSVMETQKECCSHLRNLPEETLAAEVEQAPLERGKAGCCQVASSLYAMLVDTTLHRRAAKDYMSGKKTRILIEFLAQNPHADDSSCLFLGLHKELKRSDLTFAKWSKHWQKFVNARGDCPFDAIASKLLPASLADRILWVQQLAPPCDADHFRALEDAAQSKAQKLSLERQVVRGIVDVGPAADVPRVNGIDHGRAKDAGATRYQRLLEFEIADMLRCFEQYGKITKLDAHFSLNHSEMSIYVDPECIGQLVETSELAREGTQILRTVGLRTDQNYVLADHETHLTFASDSNAEEGLPLDVILSSEKIRNMTMHIEADGKRYRLTSGAVTSGDTVWRTVRLKLSDAVDQNGHTFKPLFLVFERAASLLSGPREELVKGKSCITFTARALLDAHEFEHSCEDPTSTREVPDKLRRKLTPDLLAVLERTREIWQDIVRAHMPKGELGHLLRAMIDRSPHARRRQTRVVASGEHRNTNHEDEDEADAFVPEHLRARLALLALTGDELQRVRHALRNLRMKLEMFEIDEDSFATNIDRLALLQSSTQTVFVELVLQSDLDRSRIAELCNLVDTTSGALRIFIYAQESVVTHLTGLSHHAAHISSAATRTNSAAREEQLSGDVPWSGLILRDVVEGNDFYEENVKAARECIRAIQASTWWDNLRRVAHELGEVQVGAPSARTYRQAFVIVEAKDATNIQLPQGFDAHAVNAQCTHAALTEELQRIAALPGPIAIAVVRNAQSTSRKARAAIAKSVLHGQKKRPAMLVFVTPCADPTDLTVAATSVRMLVMSADDVTASPLPRVPVATTPLITSTRAGPSRRKFVQNFAPAAFFSHAYLTRLYLEAAFGQRPSLAELSNTIGGVQLEAGPDTRVDTDSVALPRRIFAAACAATCFEDIANAIRANLQPRWGSLASAMKQASLTLSRPELAALISCCVVPLHFAACVPAVMLYDQLCETSASNHPWTERVLAAFNCPVTRRILDSLQSADLGASAQGALSSLSALKWRLVANGAGLDAAAMTDSDMRRVMEVGITLEFPDTLVKTTDKLRCLFSILRGIKETPGAESLANQPALREFVHRKCDDATVVLGDGSEKISNALVAVLVDPNIGEEQPGAVLRDPFVQKLRELVSTSCSVPQLNANDLQRLDETAFASLVLRMRVEKVEGLWKQPLPSGLRRAVVRYGRLEGACVWWAGKLHETPDVLQGPEMDPIDPRLAEVVTFLQAREENGCLPQMVLPVSERQAVLMNRLLQFALAAVAVESFDTAALRQLRAQFRRCLDHQGVATLLHWCEQALSDCRQRGGDAQLTAKWLKVYAMLWTLAPLRAVQMPTDEGEQKCLVHTARSIFQGVDEKFELAEALHMDAGSASPLALAIAEQTHTLDNMTFCTLSRLMNGAAHDANERQQGQAQLTSSLIATQGGNYPNYYLAHNIRPLSTGVKRFFFAESSYTLDAVPDTTHPGMHLRLSSGVSRTSVKHNLEVLFKLSMRGTDLKPLTDEFNLATHGKIVLPSGARNLDIPRVQVCVLRWLEGLGVTIADAARACSEDETWGTKNLKQIETALSSACGSKELEHWVYTPMPSVAECRVAPPPSVLELFGDGSDNARFTIGALANLVATIPGSQPIPDLSIIENRVQLLHAACEALITRYVAYLEPFDSGLDATDVTAHGAVRNITASGHGSTLLAGIAAPLMQTMISFAQRLWFAKNRQKRAIQASGGHVEQRPWDAMFIKRVAHGICVKSEKRAELLRARDFHFFVLAISLSAPWSHDWINSALEVARETGIKLLRKTQMELEYSNRAWTASQPQLKYEIDLWAPGVIESSEPPVTDTTNKTWTNLPQLANRPSKPLMACPTHLKLNSCDITIRPLESVYGLLTAVCKATNAHLVARNITSLDVGGVSIDVHEPTRLVADVAEIRDGAEITYGVATSTQLAAHALRGDRAAVRHPAVAWKFVEAKSASAAAGSASQK